LEETYKSGYLFGSLIQHINDPSLVLDYRGKIMSFNDSAAELLSLGGKKEDIFSYLDETSVNELSTGIFQKLPSKIPISISLRVKLQTETQIDATLFLNSFGDKEDEYILCKIKADKNIFAGYGKTGIKIKTDNFADTINNKKIISIIEEIKSQYPFTFIGKERIQKLVNELDEIFWLQDVDGNYQLLNDKLANSLGVSIPQIEGKLLISFIPAHMVDFQNSLISYIKRSLNYLILEGVPLNNFSPAANFQTIEIPLIDVDNKVVAIVGITQRISASSYKISDSDLLSSDDDLLRFCPKPIALVDKNEIIKQATEEFCKLFEQEFDDLRKTSIKSVFPNDIIAKIEQFVLSSSAKEKCEFSNQGTFKKRYTGKIALLLNKIYNEKLEFQGFSIFVEYLDENFDPANLYLREGKMYELLVDNNPEPIFIYDSENLRFLEVNKAALDLYGYRKDEFLQLDLTDLYSTEDIQSLLDTSKKEIDKEKFSGPYKHKRKDGSTVFVELSRNSFKFDDKDANFIVIKNVSEKLELEKKNKSFNAIFDNSDNLIFVTDTGGFIAFVNDAACRILGHSKDDFKDTSFATYLIDDDRGNFNASVFKEQSKDVITLNVHLKKGDGHSIESEVMAIPILNYKNEIESFTLIVKRRTEPVVETKEIIKEVILEKPVETSVPVDTAEKVEPSFLSGLFHEILTPLNVILGFVHELTESISNLTPDQKESAEIINQNRDRLLKIMNSVVEYSNIQKNKIDFVISEVSITEIIDTLQNNIKELTSPKVIEFAYGKISSSLKFRTDKEKFQNLLNTLVRLASVITKEKKIYFSAYSESDYRVIISIKDNYTHPTKNLLEFYRNIFVNEKYDAKEYGISKLELRITGALLKVLNGKAEVSGREGNEELFFEFPLDFKKIEEKEYVGEEKQGEEIERAIEELKGESDAEKSVVEEKYYDLNDELSELEAETKKLKVEDETSELQPESYEEEIIQEVKSESESQLESEQASIEAENGKPEEGISKGALTTPDLSQLRCLYIEDQVDSQILFKVQMKELKEIKFAISFEEALPVLDSDSFDFIVIDINLQGDYNGLDALKIIQKMPGYANTPIIAVTAYVLPGDKEKFITTGFSEFVSKPIFKEKMVNVLAKLLLEKK
jgi:PAS domain S-box-containing protein